MNKKTTINIIGFIVMVIIIIILSVVYVYGAIVNIQPGTCIRNVTNSSNTICSVLTVCPRISQNFSCQPASCSVNLTCPDPFVSITNQVNNTFTNVEQPVISRDSIDKYSWVIWVVILGLIGLILWQTGIFNNLKRGSQKIVEDYSQDYEAAKENASKMARSLERKAKQEIEDIP